MNISFATFLSQRENYILTVRMYVHVCNQNESNMYIMIRDLPIGLHTALCSTSDLFFSP